MPKPTRNKYSRLESVIPKILYLRQVTILGGGPYAGKSRLSIKLAYDLALGRESVLGPAQPPMRVLYCSERDWEFNSEQIQGIVTDQQPELLDFFCIGDLSPVDAIHFELDPLTYLTKHAIDEAEPPRVVIFDTLSLFQGKAAASDISNYGSQKSDLLKMKRWGNKHNCAMLALTHAPKVNDKNRYNDVFSNIIGSVSILGSTCAATFMERINADYLRIHYRSHVSSMASPRYYSYEDFREVPQEVAEGELVPDTVPLSARQSQVLNLVPKSPMPLLDLVRLIEEQLGISDTNVRNVLNVLFQKGQIAIETNQVTDYKEVRRVLAN